MKVCLFGGTFDPPHVGHLIIAETIKESEGFDKMIFVPALLPPHKDDTPLSSVEDRLEMLRLSLGNDPDLEVSRVEIQRGGVSYTIDTVREVK
ncbi:MAG: nicotinate-nicotinamide nucleotide adenylyltransferase, partial [Fidelibacterota bacterium]